MNLTPQSERILAESLSAAWEAGLSLLRNPDDYDDEGVGKAVSYMLSKARVSTCACTWDPIVGHAVPLPIDTLRDATTGERFLLEAEDLRSPNRTECTFHVANLSKFDQRFGLQSGEGLARIHASFPNLTTVHFVGERP